MEIRIKPDYFIICGELNAWELAKLEANCKYLELENTPKGLKVKGARSRMYMLLYDLSFDFDIEIY